MTAAIDVIYDILITLEDEALGIQQNDFSIISHERFNISKERWRGVLDMLIAEGYITIDGFVKDEQYSSNNLGLLVYKKIYTCPAITLKGLEFLRRNNIK